MKLNQKIKEQIALEVIKVLVTRFDSFPENSADNRNAPFHKYFLNAFADKLNNKVSDIPFFISLSSWLQGLNTTLGQTFLENIAHILSNGSKMEFTSKRQGNLKISKLQKDNINNIITDLSNSKINPNLNLENQKLFINEFSRTDLVNAIDFSADVFYQENDKIIAIELKSVKPNSGEMRGEKQKILEGKAALFQKYKTNNIEFYIGFPFDPTSSDETAYDKKRFLNSIINMTNFFDEKETLIASELWDFLSGSTNTMEEILQIINAISTPDFLKNFNFLKNAENRSKKEYIVLLNNWFLKSEMKLCMNSKVIEQKINDDNKLYRLYMQDIFDSKGNYNLKRFNSMERIISDAD